MTTLIRKFYNADTKDRGNNLDLIQSLHSRIAELEGENFKLRQERKTQVDIFFQKVSEEDLNKHSAYSIPSDWIYDERRGYFKPVNHLRIKK